MNPRKRYCPGSAGHRLSGHLRITHYSQASERVASNTPHPRVAEVASPFGKGTLAVTTQAHEALGTKCCIRMLTVLDPIVGSAAQNRRRGTSADAAAVAYAPALAGTEMYAEALFHSAGPFLCVMIGPHCADLSWIGAGCRREPDADYKEILELENASYFTSKNFSDWSRRPE
jgi:hypothetical protein